MQKLSQLALNDEGFVFDPMTGDSYLVNETGLFILKGLRENHDEDEIAKMLTEEYEVGLEDAERDVADFQGRLRTSGLAQ